MKNRFLVGMSVCLLGIAPACGDDESAATPEGSEDAGKSGEDTTDDKETTDDEDKTTAEETTGDAQPSVDAATPSDESDGGVNASDDGGTVEPSIDAGSTEETSGEDTGDGEKPLYLMTVGVAGDGDNGALYLLVRDKIDFNFSVADLAEEGAIEFEPYSGVAAIDGHVIIGKSDQPIAQKYSVSDDRQFTKVGDDLHFGDYFQSDTDGLNFYFQAIQGTDMFLHYGADRAFRKHWNVREWKLLEDLEETVLPIRAGWTLSSTGNRSNMRDWQGAVLQTFNMYEDATGAAADESWIAVYDAETFVETDVIEVPCPGLQQQTMDEDGNVYVSTTFNTPVLSLYGQAPASCVVRVNKDGEQDEEWGNKNLADLTGGYDGVNFRYLYDGKAVANVLHHDRIQDVDWEGDVDPAVLVAVQGEWTEEGFTPEDTTLWELELIDIEAGTSTPITGWEEGHDPSSYMVNYKLDGRVFFKFQVGTYSDKPTDAIYELNLETAEVTLVGEDLEGTLDGFERIR